MLISVSLVTLLNARMMMLMSAGSDFKVKAPLPIGRFGSVSDSAICK